MILCKQITNKLLVYLSSLLFLQSQLKEIDPWTCQSSLTIHEFRMQWFLAYCSYLIILPVLVCNLYYIDTDGSNSICFIVKCILVI